MTAVTTASITEFILARLEEDEVAAREATPAPWAVDTWSDLRGGPDGANLCGSYEGDGSLIHLPDATHIARHDPARVLADCAARRAMVEGVEIISGGVKTYAQRMEHTDADDARYVITRDILLHLASVYADHEDFDPAWRL